MYLGEKGEEDMATKLSQISAPPLDENEKKRILEDFFKLGANVETPNWMTFFTNLTTQVTVFLNEYNIAWQGFNKSFNIESAAARQKNIDPKKGYSLGSRKGAIKYATAFIKVLEKGELLLHTLRTILTQQSINTTFTIVGKDGVYTTDKKNIPYRLVLSSYGSSGNNYVSLAYKTNVNQVIKDLKNDINNQSFDEISHTNLYSKIWEQKLKYLKQLSIEKNKTYKPYFDSKDAEIYDLYSQTKSDPLSLTLDHYRSLRKSMGGGGGKKTTSLQAGDVGLTQDKLVSTTNQTVNFARQTLIFNHFLKLQNALQQLHSNPVQLKDTLLELFTADSSVSQEGIIKGYNGSAKYAIEEIFRNFPNT